MSLELLIKLAKDYPDSIYGKLANYYFHQGYQAAKRIQEEKEKNG